jgi:hypothetical protein
VDGGVPAGRFLEPRGSFFSRKKMRPDETSAVDVSGQHYDRDGEQSPERTEWDLVNVTAREIASFVSSRAKRDQPGKVLIQLESLILAQSERWRQA